MHMTLHMFFAQPYHSTSPTPTLTSPSCVPGAPKAVPHSTEPSSSTSLLSFFFHGEGGEAAAFAERRLSREGRSARCFPARARKVGASGEEPHVAADGTMPLVLRPAPRADGKAGAANKLHSGDRAESRLPLPRACMFIMFIAM